MSRCVGGSWHLFKLTVLTGCISSWLGNEQQTINRLSCLTSTQAKKNKNHCVKAADVSHQITPGEPECDFSSFFVECHLICFPLCCIVSRAGHHTVYIGVHVPKSYHRRRRHRRKSSHKDKRERTEHGTEGYKSDGETADETVTNVLKPLSEFWWSAWGKASHL